MGRVLEQRLHNVRHHVLARTLVGAREARGKRVEPRHARGRHPHKCQREVRAAAHLPKARLHVVQEAREEVRGRLVQRVDAIVREQEILHDEWRHAA